MLSARNKPAGSNKHLWPQRDFRMPMKTPTFECTENTKQNKRYVSRTCVPHSIGEVVSWPAGGNKNIWPQHVFRMPTKTPTFECTKHTLFTKLSTNCLPTVHLLSTTGIPWRSLAITGHHWPSLAITRHHWLLLARSEITSQVTSEVTSGVTGAIINAKYVN